MARGGAVAGLLLAVALPAAGLGAAAASAQAPRSAPGDVAENRLTVPSVAGRPPAGRLRQVREVARTAEGVPAIRRELARHGSVHRRTFLLPRGRWQVSFYASDGPGREEEVAQVILDDRTGRVLEHWTGIQVAWTMARGYPGAFGRAVNAPPVWLGLSGLFLLPFLRRPLRMLHLDLAAVLSLSASYALFGAGEIGWSVPLAYPPLVYLLARLLWIARARSRGAAAPEPLGLLVGHRALAAGIVGLAAFRVGLNLTGSNVIDVGYAGVIGADRIAAGEALYGSFPADNPRGDTYGPLAYLAYAPFEALLPWSGRWDGLPAAHAAAMAFDLLAAWLMWLAGRRLRGPGLGLLLAYLWLACPWTALVAGSNSNDSLVAVLVLSVLLLAGRPLGRGAAVAAAGLTKLAPLALLPLLAGHPAGPGGPSRPATATIAGFAATAGALLAGVVLLDGGLTGFADRAVRFPLERESPFSVWGLWELGPAQVLAQAAAAGLALAVAFRPRRRDAVTLAALAGAVLIAVQLAASHWFYLYVVWFLPPLLLAVLGGYAEPARSTGSMLSARPGPEHRTRTALSQGSSSAGT